MGLSREEKKHQSKTVLPKKVITIFFKFGVFGFLDALCKEHM